MGTIGFCRITLPIVLAASFHLFPTAPHAEVLAPEADSSVRGDLTVRRNDNYGCDPVLLVGGSRDGEAYGEPDAIRSFLRFDLSGITGQVSSATLELTVDGFRSDNPPQVFDLSVHRVLGSWNEGDGNECGPWSNPAGCTDVDSAEGIAWDGTDENNQTQPSFDPAPAAELSVNEVTTQTGDVVVFDVTDLVRDWLTGNAANYGLVIRDVTSDGSFRHMGFSSREVDSFVFECPIWPSPTPGPRLRINQPIPVEKKSWGQIKSIYAPKSSK